MIRRNVLIFHQGAMGDFIVTWPLLLALARLHPQSRVHVVTHSQKGALAERLLGIESSDCEGGWHALFSEDAALPDGQRALIGQAHSLVSFVADPGSVWAKRVAEEAPEALCTFLQPRPTGKQESHVSRFIIGQVTSPALRSAAEQMLRSIESRGITASRHTQVDVLLHPGSGSERKCWPLENFIGLARGLRESGRSVRLVIGEAERDRWGVRAVRDLRSAADVVEPVTLLDLLEQMLACRACVMNDSGPAHLAGIVGLPLTVLFGPGEPQVWRPLGPNVNVMHRQPIESIGVDEVEQCVQTQLALAQV